MGLSIKLWEVGDFSIFQGAGTHSLYLLVKAELGYNK